MKILDFLVHGGHQYEFFKNDAKFYCMGVSGELHTHESLGRPKQENVFFIQNHNLENLNPDIVMIRAGINYEKYYPFIKGGAKAIAVIQTNTPFKIPDWCKIVVWNSKISMDNFSGQMKNKKHHYIVHGFDPSEFKLLNIERNNRILSSYSLFKQREAFLGYNHWSLVNNKLNICDVIGHGNEDIKNNIGTFSYPKLVDIYNSYYAYLNTSTHSAMPRSRGEAMMCGLPIITTSNYDAKFYFKNKINCLIADNADDMIKSINLLLSNKSLFNDISNNGRNAAIKYFNIKDYIQKWSNILK